MRCRLWIERQSWWLYRNMSLCCVLGRITFSSRTTKELPLCILLCEIWAWTYYFNRHLRKISSASSSQSFPLLLYLSTNLSSCWAIDYFSWSSPKLTFFWGLSFGIFFERGWIVHHQLFPSYTTASVHSCSNNEPNSRICLRHKTDSVLSTASWRRPGQLRRRDRWQVWPCFLRLSVLVFVLFSNLGLLRVVLQTVFWKIVS